MLIVTVITLSLTTIKIPLFINYNIIYFRTINALIEQNVDNV